MSKVQSVQTTDGIREKVVSVRRTAKVVSGGRVFGFSACVVVGSDGMVGFAIGKAREVSAAIQKATEAARRNMISISLDGTTVHHKITATHGASKVLMMPAPDGTGIIAGSAMRAVFEVVGIENILAKSIGSCNPINVLRATVNGLQSQETAITMAEKRGKSVAEILEGSV